MKLEYLQQKKMVEKLRESGMNEICGYPITSLYSSPSDNEILCQFINPTANPGGWLNQREVETYEKENGTKLLDQLCNNMSAEGYSHLISIPSSKAFVRNYASYISKRLNLVHIEPLSKIDPLKRRAKNSNDHDQNLQCIDQTIVANGIIIFDGIVARGRTIDNAIKALSGSISANQRILVVSVFDFRKHLQMTHPHNYPQNESSY